MPSSEVMHKWKTGKLHSGGPDGPKVTSQKQAVAIMKSEERTEAKHGGHYPEKSYFQGGSTMSKSSGLHDASYAQGGSVLPRSRDFKKEPDTDFIQTKNRFTGKTPPPGVTTEDDFGKGGSSGGNPKPADKSEAPVKPRR
jgi:uncharacterized protein DUF6496